MFQNWRCVITDAAVCDKALHIQVNEFYGTHYHYQTFVKIINKCSGLPSDSFDSLCDGFMTIGVSVKFRKNMK